MQENGLQSPGLFSSLIDAAYVAPMQLESPFWCSFPSFVEEARSKIRAGSIRTVAGLDDFMYYMVSREVLNLNDILTLRG
jgi:hypothetical protein